MASFNTPIDSTKIRTWTVVTSPGALDADSATTFATLNTAGYDVVGVEITQNERAGARADLLSLTVIGKNRV